MKKAIYLLEKMVETWASGGCGAKGMVIWEVPL
jgi:hypothetical protein